MRAMGSLGPLCVKRTSAQALPGKSHFYIGGCVQSNTATLSFRVYQGTERHRRTYGYKIDACVESHSSSSFGTFGTPANPCSGKWQRQKFTKHGDFKTVQFLKTSNSGSARGELEGNEFLTRQFRI